MKNTGCKSSSGQGVVKARNNPSMADWSEGLSKMVPPLNCVLTTSWAKIVRKRLLQVSSSMSVAWEGEFGSLLRAWSGGSGFRCCWRRPVADMYWSGCLVRHGFIVVLVSVSGAFPSRICGTYRTRHNAARTDCPHIHFASCTKGHRETGRRRVQERSGQSHVPVENVIDKDTLLQATLCATKVFHTKKVTHFTTTRKLVSTDTDASSFCMAKLKQRSKSYSLASHGSMIKKSAESWQPLTEPQDLGNE